MVVPDPREAARLDSRPRLSPPHWTLSPPPRAPSSFSHWQQREKKLLRHREGLREGGESKRQKKGERHGGNGERHGESGERG